MTQARHPVLYGEWGVPDTPLGRFEMVLLHLTLADRRLMRSGGEGPKLARALNEHFIVDMDDTMREMTFGDLAVPREIKQVTTALLDRHKAYSAALSVPGSPTLQEVLTTQLRYLGESQPFDMVGLTDYVREAAAGLDQLSNAQVLAGDLSWPAPGGSAPPR